MVGVMMLTSKGTAGIAGGAFIVLASTISRGRTCPAGSAGPHRRHRPPPQRRPGVHQRPGQRDRQPS